MTWSERVEACYKSIADQIPFQPQMAVILGSGLGNYAECQKAEAVIPYETIENFPRSTVAGHKGQFVFSYIEGVSTVLMQGRVHYYEGYEMEEVVLPIRLMQRMGAENLLLTCAAGAVNEQFSAGELMLIKDHISCFVPSPLIGTNDDKLGSRFPDMSEVYNKEYRELIRNAAKTVGISLQEGVYLQLSGPAYETPAEIRMIRGMGADAVGMSTACEAIAANHMGMKVMGVSFLSNLASGMREQPLSHKEVQEAADLAEPRFRSLVTEIIRQIGKK